MNYHSRKDHLSKHMLDLIAKSPAHLKAYLDGKMDGDTEALRFGRVFHAYMLEPNLVVTEPEVNKRTKDGKAELEAWRQSLPEGIEIASQADIEILKPMREAVMSHKFAAKLLANGEPEVEVYSEIDGYKVKCKPDFINRKAGLLVDLKSTMDASPYAFSYDCGKHRYHVQDVWYRNVCESAGIEAQDMVFIAVEKKPPFNVMCYTLDDDSKRQGMTDVDRDFWLYKYCMKANEWPGYGTGIMELQLPKRFMNVSEG